MNRSAPLFDTPTPAEAEAPSPAPFDALAAGYDSTFSESLLGRLLRDSVHEEMTGAFRAGDHVLDLGCGTGEDARRLAERGVRVYGIDLSTEMVKLARAKTTGLDVRLEVGDLSDLHVSAGDGAFNGALANFGSLNSVRSCGALARSLGRLVRPGGRVFLVVMGRWCPWEWLWYASRGSLRTALRRLRGSAGSSAGTVYYPSPDELIEVFAGSFEHVRTCGIGVLLPPTSASDLVARHGAFFRRAARLERRIRHTAAAARFNDHFLLELRRREIASLPRFACPSCLAVLAQSHGSEHLRCPEEDILFERRDGILHLVSPERASRFEQFVSEYDQVRHAEGRGAESPEYYRALPFKDTTGRFARDWKIRAAGFGELVRSVVRPLEREPGRRLELDREHARRLAPELGRQRQPERRVLRILDLGSGCGWMSYRLARRGHQVFAVDLRTDARDGLGAHAHYGGAFTPVCAEFDRLPFIDRSFDLVIFNASFHYSENYERTLNEVLRVLAEDGRIAILDTPLYRRSFSGAWMVAARERDFMRRFGFASNSIKSQHFLTPARLRELSAETGLSWTIHQPWHGFRWALRPIKARLRRCCEPARFAVIEGRARLDVEGEIRSSRPLVAARLVGRAYYRATRLLTYGGLESKAPGQPGHVKTQSAPGSTTQPIIAEPTTVNITNGRAGHPASSQEATRRFEVTGRSSSSAAPETHTIRAAGLHLEIAIGVFDPVLYRSGGFLADVVRRRDLEGRAVLDLGTGSGIAAIVAALWGARVTATDVSSSALACAARNAERYAVDIDLRRSDLFEKLGDRHFDIILFNPPYFTGEPANEADCAWRSSDGIDCFAAGLDRHLKDTGYALVVLSTDGACPRYLRTLDRSGFLLARVASTRFLNETLTVYRIAP